jgi:hypothetical protein
MGEYEKRMRCEKRENMRNSINKYKLILESKVNINKKLLILTYRVPTVMMKYSKLHLRRFFSCFEYLQYMFR